LGNIITNTNLVNDFNDPNNITIPDIKWAAYEENYSNFQDLGIDQNIFYNNVEIVWSADVFNRYVGIKPVQNSVWFNGTQAEVTIRSI
jgi:hypothetical protein